MTSSKEPFSPAPDPSDRLPGVDAMLQSSQRSMTALARASEYMIESMLALALRQGFIGRRLMEEGFIGLQALAQAQAPQDLVRAELTLLREQTKHVGDAVQELNDSLRRCSFETMSIALDLPEAPPKAA